MPPTPQAPPMPASTRTLISLPPEVLSEILIFTLDRPQGPLRPAVLQTCSLLHSIGLPLLFRFVRLGTVASWKAMVGVGGWLVSVRDNGRGMGRHVRELELNRKGTGDWSFPLPSLPLSLLHTTKVILHHRILDTWLPCPAISTIASIPTSLLRHIFLACPSTTTLTYHASPTPTYPYPPSSGRYKFARCAPVAELLGLVAPAPKPGHPPHSPAAEISTLPNLRTIEMVGDLILDDPRPTENALFRSVAFSLLSPSIDTLIISFAKDAGSQSRAESVYECLLVGSEETEWEERWRGLKRIEIRSCVGQEKGGGAEKMEGRWRKRWEKGARGERKGSEERLMGKVVFVDEEGGEERPLFGWVE